MKKWIKAQIGRKAAETPRSKYCNGKLHDSIGQGSIEDMYEA